MIIKCPECGNDVSDKAELCPHCGLNIQKHLFIDNDVNENSRNENEEIQSVSIVQTIIPSENEASNSVSASKSKRKILFLCLIVVTIVIIISGISYYNHLKAITPTEIKLELEQGSLEQNSKTAPLDYTIIPDTASDAPVTWESSDESIAVIDENGCLHTNDKLGTCTITVRVNKQVFDSFRLTVKKSKPDFAELRDILDEDHLFTEVSSDGSYLRVDTNPLDVDNFSSSKGMQIIVDANNELGLPESVWQKMTTTRALDGQITETHNNITVTWWYHPDSGLNVLYEIDD